VRNVGKFFAISIGLGHSKKTFGIEKMKDFLRKLIIVLHQHSKDFMTCYQMNFLLSITP
jgi:hypothetical protein